MGNTYVVLGASGQIGKILTEELLKKGHRVRGVVRDKKKMNEKAFPALEIITADLERADQLAPLFIGADAVFSFLPPGHDQSDLGAYQDRVGEAISEAIKKEKIKYALNLSSVGAQLKNGTGPIAGLHRQEERLNQIESLNVLHLRPNYFMQNLYQMIPSIVANGVISSFVRGNLGIPMIDTDDIGRKAADLLDRLDFVGYSAFDYAGPREVTLIETTHILGKAIGWPELKFHQATEEEARKGMELLGIGSLTIDLMIEMENAFNERIINPSVPLSPPHQGTTTIEMFADKFAKKFEAFQLARR